MRTNIANQPRDSILWVNILRVLSLISMKEYVDGNYYLPTLSLDTEYINDASKILCFPSEDSHLQGSLALQSELTVLNGRVCSTAAATESTSCQNSVSLDHMTVRELQDAFHGMFGRETVVIDKQWLKHRILLGLHNNFELDRPLNFTCCGSISHDKEDKSTVASGTESSENAPDSPKWMLDGGFKMDEKIKGSSSDSQNYSSGASESDITFHGKEENEMGVLVTGKRVHKPPRRYIEESSEFKSRSHPRRSCVSVKSPKSKVVDAKIHKQREEEVNEAARSGHQMGSFDGACIQVPFGLPVEEGQAKGNTLCLVRNSLYCLHVILKPHFHKLEKTGLLFSGRCWLYGAINLSVLLFV